MPARLGLSLSNGGWMPATVAGAVRQGRPYVTELFHVVGCAI